jgi:DNA-binding NarL/FixJ family response regulator
MIRALIAGRSRVHREALALALSQARRVRVLGTAPHRGEILTRLAEGPPDLVLVDFAMPEAASIVAEIRCRTPSVKVVAITLGETEAEVIQLAEAGVAGYVLPDGSLDDLIIAVESAVRGELYCPRAWRSRSCVWERSLWGARQRRKRRRDTPSTSLRAVSERSCD